VKTVSKVRGTWGRSEKRRRQVGGKEIVTGWGPPKRGVGIRRKYFAVGWV